MVILKYCASRHLSVFTHLTIVIVLLLEYEVFRKNCSHAVLSLVVLHQYLIIIYH